MSLMVQCFHIKVEIDAALVICRLTSYPLRINLLSCNGECNNQSLLGSSDHRDI